MHHTTSYIFIIMAETSGYFFIMQEEEVFSRAQTSFIHPFTDLICNCQTSVKFHLPFCACIFTANGILKHHLINIHFYNKFTEVECHKK